MSKRSTNSAPLAIRLTHLLPLPRFILALAGALPLLVLLAMAQGAGAQDAYPPGAALDPPGRVARLNLIEGTVSFAPAEAGPEDASAWRLAALNRPITTGDRLWTGPGARSELHAGSTVVRMSEQTSLDFLAMDDNLTQLRLAQGSAQLRVRTLFEGQRLEVDTPNLAFVISQPGNYRLDVNPASNTTRVVALSGSGVIYGDNGAALNLGAGQQGSFSGTELVPAAPGPAFQDSFDQWAAARDRREDASVSARYVPRETIGYMELDSYGDWQQDPQYGAVWLPRAMPVNWAPYRAGHWSWIAPWGWTWVDDAPWGFAPFHYGRWAEIGRRWAWVPGHLPQRPVYAPALVAFVGGSSGGLDWRISIGSGAAPQPAVGWFPLAPGEAFRPFYRASPRYITQVNNNITVNQTVNITNNYRYQHQPAAVTAVSRDDFFRGRSAAGRLHAPNAAQLGSAQLLGNDQALPPRPAQPAARRPVPAAALPPPAVAQQPVIQSRGVPGNDRRGAPERIAPPPARSGNHEATPRQFTLPTTPPAALPPALPPLAAPLPNRHAAEGGPPVPREQAPRALEQPRQREAQQQQQRQQADQARQQAELARQQDTQRRQGEAQQQQLQRDQQRQQAEQARQQEMQRRQNAARQPSQLEQQQRAEQAQAQTQAQHAQQEQARQQLQRSVQQEQRRLQAQEPPRPPAAEARTPRPDMERERKRSQEP